MIALDRRTVLRLGVLAPLVGAVGGLTGPAAGAASTSPYLRTTWTPYVGKTFTLRSPSGTAQAVLAGVNDVLGGGAGSFGRFSLDFSLTSGAAPDALTSVTRRGFAGADLFLSPVDRGLTQTHALAVVNRI